MLSLINELIDSFENNDIQYCHWKSNQKLNKLVKGEIDLDFLVPRYRANEIEVVLNKLDFKRIISPPWSRFPGIQDWVALDRKTGSMVHLHLHYRLNTGRSFTKEIHINLEEHILKHSDYDEEFGVKTPEFCHQLLLFLLRCSVKKTYVDLIKSLVSGKFFAEEERNELEYILSGLQKVNDDPLEKIKSDEKIPDQLTTICKQLLEDNKSRGLFVKITSFQPQCDCAEMRMSKTSRIAKAWFRWFWDKFYGLLNRIGFNKLRGKILSNGGVVIALTGPDGSGKSTIAEQISTWLEWKIDCRKIYMGTGSGKTSPMIFLYEFLTDVKRFFFSTDSASQAENLNSSEKDSSNAGLMRTTIKNCFKYMVARAKLKKVEECERLRANGSVVITDRFPQSGVRNFYDGPKCNEPESYFYRKEHEIFCRIKALNPDIAVKLYVDLEEAIKRKPNDSKSLIARKINVTDDIKFQGSDVIKVDANKKLEEVRKEIKKYIWDNM